MRELSHPKTPDSVAAWARSLPPWVEVRAPQTDLHLGIGADENEAISLAVELGIAVLMDEQVGRSVAEQRGVTTLGTLAVLNIADASGWLDFEEAVSKLRATSFRSGGAVLEKVRALVRARKNS